MSKRSNNFQMQTSHIMEQVKWIRQNLELSKCSTEAEVLVIMPCSPELTAIFTNYLILTKVILVHFLD